ncbi:MAG: hypothetical protein ACEQSK_06945 [Sphingomonadaceae bacterium]
MFKFIKSLFITPPPPLPELSRRRHLHEAALDLLAAESTLCRSLANRDTAAARLKHLQSFNYQALSREIDGNYDGK